MSHYEPCTKHLERLSCVHCGEQITSSPNPAAMREHINNQCTASIREGCSLWYDALAPADGAIILCLDCIPEDHYATMPDPEYPDLRTLYTPVTIDDAADSYSYCDACLRPLTYHRLTREGQQYEAAAAVEAARDEDARELLAELAEDADADELLAIVHETLGHAEYHHDTYLLEMIAAALTDYTPGARAERRERLRAEWNRRSYNPAYTREQHAADLKRYTDAADLDSEQPPRFDRFDIAEAHYLYAHDYGDYQRITRLRERLKFRPSPFLTSRDNLTPNGRAIYDALASRADTDQVTR